MDSPYMELIYNDGIFWVAEGHRECDPERNILLLPLPVSLLPGSPEVFTQLSTEIRQKAMGSAKRGQKLRHGDEICPFSF